MYFCISFKNSTFIAITTYVVLNQNIPSDYVKNLKQATMKGGNISKTLKIAYPIASVIKEALSKYILHIKSSLFREVRSLDLNPDPSGVTGLTNNLQIP